MKTLVPNSFVSYLAVGLCLSFLMILMAYHTLYNVRGAPKPSWKRCTGVVILLLVLGLAWPILVGLIPVALVLAKKP